MTVMKLGYELKEGRMVSRMKGLSASLMMQLKEQRMEQKLKVRMMEKLWEQMMVKLMGRSNTHNYMLQCRFPAMSSNALGSSTRSQYSLHSLCCQVDLSPSS